uniref:Uncharacterized protein n=1 Tax=Fagus sylvatica TaxID=28930 RepID=A0A2N9G2M3_FAGSY
MVILVMIMESTHMCRSSNSLHRGTDQNSQPILIVVWFDRGCLVPMVMGIDGSQLSDGLGLIVVCVGLEDNDIADFGASFGGRAPRHRRHFHWRFQKL